MAVGWSLAAKNEQVNASGVNSTARWVGAFNGDPTAGGVEVTGGAYTRQQVTYPTSTNNNATTNIIGIQMPQGAVATHVARFSTVTGGTPYDVRALPNGGETFNSAGTLYLSNAIFAN